VAPAARSHTADAGIVARRELFDLLADARRVTVVSAPAGSGKTYLLRSWLAETGLDERAAWITLERGEDDPQRFWRSVLRALRGTSAGSGAIQAVTPNPALNAEVMVERLLADLPAIDGQLWLVLDDLHELRSSEGLRQLKLLLMRSPPELRFVLVTRRDLRLGLHRLRLEGELSEIRAGDLRFSLDETRALFNAASTATGRPRASYSQPSPPRSSPPIPNSTSSPPQTSWPTARPRRPNGT
jgi:LuxR family maltose regulon positive regulatory protein